MKILLPLFIVLTFLLSCNSSSNNLPKNTKPATDNEKQNVTQEGSGAVQGDQNSPQGGQSTVSGGQITPQQKETCKAKTIPSIAPVKTALNNFLNQESVSEFEKFNEISASVESFTNAFLNAYPSNCDSSKIVSALNELNTESLADNQLDAGKIYLNKIAKIFSVISQHVQEELKPNIEAVKAEFVSLAEEYYIK